MYLYMYACIGNTINEIKYVVHTKYIVIYSDKVDRNCKC